jgi:sialic acid synthase
MYKKPVLIAEVGCNHKGDFEIAKSFIKVAADFCKIKFIKFQKRDNKILFSPEEYNLPHPVAENSYGKSYGKHRDALEFNINQHKELFKECLKNNLTYSSSVWDLNSAHSITSLKPEFIKVGSATNLNFSVLKYLCENYKGKIHLSLGMTTKNEEEKIVNFFESKNRNKDLILYACTSAYPVDSANVCLLEIKRLVEKYKVKKKVFDIGFSGHHNGISLDIAAYTLGANYIERHFTLDRTWKGTDHAASIEPDGMRRLNRNLEALYLALNYKDQEILEIERDTRKKMKKKVELNCKEK